MEQKYDYEEKCARYVLGELSEQEQALFEEAYFADDLLFERFLAVKDDLIDAYARGDLTEEKRERFERHFLASEPHRQQVNEAKDLIRAVSSGSLNGAIVNVMPAASARGSDSSRWQSIARHFALHPFVLRGAITALLLVALAGSWALVRQFQRPQPERGPLQDEEAVRRKQEGKGGQTLAPPVNENRTDLAGNNPANLSTNKASTNSNLAPVSDRAPQSKTTKKQFPQPLPAEVASLSLLPFISRDVSSSNSLQIGPDTRAVRLRLAFKGENYRHYDAFLRTVTGEQVLHRRALKARSNDGEKSVTLTLVPSIFRRQDYIMTLSGLTVGGKSETIGDYYFRVERKSPTSPDQ